MLRQRSSMPAAVHRLAGAGAYCTNATWSPQSDEAESGMPRNWHSCAWPPSWLTSATPGERLARFHFDPALRRMTTGGPCGCGYVAYVKGAPEEVLPRCTRQAGNSDVLSPTSGVTS